MRRLAALIVLVPAAVAIPATARSAETERCFGAVATIVGTEGNDVIRGTKGDDVIVALGGNDVVRPGAGDDIVCGGQGNDYLVTHRGQDALYGGPGGDRIEGFSTEPTQVYGNDGADFLFLQVTAEPTYYLDGGAGPDIGEIHGDPDLADAALVINRRTGTLRRAGVQTGGMAGIEQLGLDDLMPYEYYGNRLPDLVTVAGGAFPFRAKTYLGNDVVVSAEGDDVIDTGRGQDRVDAGPGADVCLNAERTRGCESRD